MVVAVFDIDTISSTRSDSNNDCFDVHRLFFLA